MHLQLRGEQPLAPRHLGLVVHQQVFQQRDIAAAHIQFIHQVFYIGTIQPVGYGFARALPGPDQAHGPTTPVGQDKLGEGQHIVAEDGQLQTLDADVMDLDLGDIEP